MRVLRWLLSIVIAVVLIVLAVANREPVTVRLLPPELAAFLGLAWEARVPLFLVVLAAVAMGLLIGQLLEWMRERRIRRAAREARREAEALRREVQAVRPANPRDEILELIEKA